ncbi:ATP-binding protein [Alteromonadaceae bacterium M269]|nr:ATP-binding protein [Alteromonadaceae bacterium M269]
MNQPAEQVMSKHYLTDQVFYQDCIDWLTLRLAIEVERIRCSRGDDFREGFGGLYISDEEINEFVRQSGMGDDWQSGCDRLKQQWRQIQQKKAATSGLKIQRVERLFDLMPTESFVLLLTYLPEIEPRLRKVFAYLQDDVQKKQVTLALCQRLFPESLSSTDWHAILLYQEPLRRAPLINFDGSEANRFSQGVSCDDGVRNFLSGHPLPDESLHGQLRWFVPEPNACEVHQPTNSAVAALKKLRQAHSAVAQWPLTTLSCNDNDHCLQTLADVLRMPVYALSLSEATGRQSFSRALRDAWLNDALLVVIWQDSAVQQSFDWREFKYGWLVLHTPDVVPLSFATLALDWPLVSTEDQHIVWREQLPEAYLKLDKIDEDLSELVQQFQLTYSDIETICQQLTFNVQWMESPISIEQIWQSCRQIKAAPIAKLAQSVSTVFGWEDLIVSSSIADELRAFQRDVRYSVQFIQQSAMDRVLGAAPSVSGLFSGASGTGKTMAASVLANELGLDLFKVDLSRVVSKYIGETEKNLDRIFTAAASSRAILFFDEGDALFGKRSEVKDAHDRYANIEVSYLLQKMEEHPGCTIIATNFADNIDEAFSRRLEHIIHFPMPAELERRRIWLRVKLLSVELNEDIDFDFLAQRFVLSGGQIRNSLIAACYQAKEQAAPVSMMHLLLAAMREYRKLKLPIKRSVLGEYYDALMDA